MLIRWIERSRFRGEERKKEENAEDGRLAGEIYERYFAVFVSAHSFLPFTRVRKQAHVMRLIRRTEATRAEGRVLLRSREETDSKALPSLSFLFFLHSNGFVVRRAFRASACINQTNDIRRLFAGSETTISYGGRTSTTSEIICLAYLSRIRGVHLNSLHASCASISW